MYVVTFYILQDFVYFEVNIRQTHYLRTVPRQKLINKENWSTKRTMVSRQLNKNENIYINEKSKSWEPLRICLLNSTANPANFHTDLI